MCEVVLLFNVKYVKRGLYKLYSVCTVSYAVWFQDRNDMYANLYTIKWLMQCFLDRVCWILCSNHMSLF